MNEKEHKLWLANSRKAMLEIISSTPDKNNRFSWSGIDYSRRMIGVYCEYATGRDLTASMLEWWLDHPSGDVPPYHLADVIEAMGDLWDKAVVDMVWPHLIVPR